VLAIISDTHGTDDHRLEGRTLAAVREADLVIHAGDFTTEAVLDAIEAEVGQDTATPAASRLVAVSGNNDTAGVRDRLDSTAIVTWSEARIVVVHGHEHDETALDLLGRQEGADLVVMGHSHRPRVDTAGTVPTVNPGSYADPRWYRPAHAELEPEGAGLVGRLVQPDGGVLSEFEVAVTGRE
jgi:putative phosphoesterase